MVIQNTNLQWANSTYDGYYFCFKLYKPSIAGSNIDIIREERDCQVFYFLYDPNCYLGKQ